MKLVLHLCIGLLVLESTQFTTGQDLHQTVSFHRVTSHTSRTREDIKNASILHRFLRKLDKPVKHNQTREKTRKPSTSTRLIPADDENQDISFEFDPAALSEGVPGRLELASKIYSQKDKALVDLSALHEREARQREHASWLRDECRTYPGHCRELLNVVPRRSQVLHGIHLEPGAKVESSTARYVLVHKMTPEDGLSTSLLPYPTSFGQSKQERSLIRYGIQHKEQAKALVRAYAQEKSILWPSHSEPLVLARSDRKSPAIRTPLQYLVHPAFDNSLYVPVSPIIDDSEGKGSERKQSFAPETDENYVHPDGTEHDHDYILRGQIGRGGQGEVWRAIKVTEEQNEKYILKRVFSYRGRRVVESGWREVYFGELLKHHKHVSSLIEYFTVTRYVKPRSELDEERIPVTELWLVFEDEGSSLHKFLYDPNVNMGETDEDGGDVSEDSQEEGLVLRRKEEADVECRKLIGSNAMFEDTSSACRHLIAQYRATLPRTHQSKESPKDENSGSKQNKQSFDHPLTASLFWKELRLDPRGGEVFQDLLIQFLEALSQLHYTGVIHRDIKPANIALNTEAHPPLLKLLDFGSALHDTVIEYLYHDPPSQSDETLAYSPPEVLMDQQCAYYDNDPRTYDIWSAGVVVLELLFATQPHELFQVDSRNEQIIKHAMQGAESREVRKAVLAAGFGRFCIFPSTTSFTDDKSENRSFEGTFSKIHRRQYSQKSGTTLCEADTLESFRSALRLYNLENLQKHGLVVNSAEQMHHPLRELGGIGEEILFRMLRWDPAERISADTAKEMLTNNA